MELYDYEPYRLIRDDDGHIIEQDKALVRYKLAESRRAAQQSARFPFNLAAAKYARRARMEAKLFAAWAEVQQATGRQDRLTFGDFVREMNIHVCRYYQ